MKKKSFSISKQIKSFSHAFNGFRILLREEHNSRIHLFAALITIAAGAILKISTFEWIAIILSIGLVFAFEIFNSSLENMADFVSPEKNYIIKKVKDLAAAGVLVVAITSIIIGLLIFVPKIVLLLSI